MVLFEPQFPYLVSEGMGTAGCLSGSGIPWGLAFHFLNLLSLFPQRERAKPAHNVPWDLVQCDLLQGGLDTQWYLWNKPAIYNLECHHYWPSGRSLFLPCPSIFSTRWKAPATFPGLCKMYISEHRNKSISRADQAEEKWPAPHTASVGYCAFIPQICFEILLCDPSLCPFPYLPPPGQSILCQSPSANNVLLPLFFKPLKWFLSFSFPTNCIFPVESLSWYNQQTNCSSRSPGPMLADPCTSYAFQPPLFCN